jgi:hypothetical protein
MKIAVECNSILLQKALEKFLAKHLTSLKNSDIVIRDFKNDDRNFYISSDDEADLKKPFSRSQLLLALENRYKELDIKKEKPKEQIIENKNFGILQKRIEMLTKEYQDNIIKAIKAFYG